MKTKRKKQDETYWEGLKFGHESEFASMYKFYFPWLGKKGAEYADVDLVKDCIQELFLDLRKAGGNLSKPPRDLKAYLKTSLKNRVIKTLRRNKKEVSQSLLTKDIRFKLSEFPDESISVIPLKRERNSRIVKAFEKLPPKYQTPLWLFYVSEYSHKEIAQLTGLNTEEAARSIVHRGKKALVKIYREVYKDL